MRLAFFALIASSALLASPATVAGANWPIKTIDLSDNGNLCDTTTEQYLKVEAHDFHDHPKMTMTWRQLTGACGGAAESELLEWTAIYDESRGDSGPTEDGRVQLDLFLCCPFGDYELEIQVQSDSEDGSTLQQRTSWGIKSGLDEYPIWDTVSTDLKDDERYSPTIQGVYTWPLPGETGFYRSLYAGPLTPTECFDKAPYGTVYKGCYAGGIFKRGEYSSSEKGPDGMTPEACFNFCDGSEFFGLENGDECYCGTASEFEAAMSTTECGAGYSSLCTGDATIRCGGNGSTDVYENTRVSQAMRSLVASGPYVSEGCFIDAKGSRIMDTLFTHEPMSAEICYGTCIEEGYHYFGTQFGRQCWCGKDSDLTLNGEEASPSECSMVCDGSVTNEICGGYLRMSAYKINSGVYVGCYADEASHRAMKKTTTDFSEAKMTNERCRSHCLSLGFSHAGTQYGKECWCSDGDAFARHGESTSCDFPCAGDGSQVCGGYYAISVYAS